MAYGGHSPFPHLALINTVIHVFHVIRAEEGGIEPHDLYALATRTRVPYPVHGPLPATRSTLMWVT
jgi:hypothetical protein